MEMSEKPKKTGLELLREPFSENLINWKPQGTRKQNECPDSEKITCKICGGWHHPRVVHLAYVGHAALTDRLLDADPLWTWEPLALHDGLPAFDSTGGLWIKLTVCGHSRLGYGHAPASSFKEIGSREKEVIGDALRNAAMRFGAALDLWHKGDLHVDETDGDKEKEKPATQTPQKPLQTTNAPQGDQSPVPKISIKQKGFLEATIKKYKIDRSFLKTQFGIEHIEDLPMNKMNEALKWCEENGDVPL